MTFNTGQRLALAVIREVANLVKPNTGHAEYAIAAFSFDLTFLQAQCLNNPLIEQFDGALQVALLRATFLRWSLRWNNEFFHSPENFTEKNFRNAKIPKIFFLRFTLYIEAVCVAEMLDVAYQVVDGNPL